jgi:hypothetical protein
MRMGENEAVEREDDGEVAGFVEGAAHADD